jgi:hypothetical protein
MSPLSNNGGRNWRDRLGLPKRAKELLIARVHASGAAETNVYGQLMWACLNFVQF